MAREVITGDNAAYLTQLSLVKCGWITQVKWSPNGDSLAVASATGVLLFVNTFGGEPTYDLQGHEGHVKGVAFSADGGLLASCGADMTARLWDLVGGTPREIAVLRGHRDSVDAVAFHPDGTILATASADKTVRLWDVKTGELKTILEGHESEVTSVAFALQGNTVVSGGWDKSLRIWDVAGETKGAVLGEHDDWVREIISNVSGTMVASASKDMTVQLWDIFGMERYARIHAHDHGADCVAFTSDGGLLASGGRDNNIRLWNVSHLLDLQDVDQSEAEVVLEGHEKPVMSIDFNAAGTLIASGSGDNTVRLWSVTRA